MRGDPDTLGRVVTSDPVNWSHWVNQSLEAWWLALPETAGAEDFYDLTGRYHGKLAGFTTASTGWRDTTRPGGCREILVDDTGGPNRVDFTPDPRPSSITLSVWVKAHTGFSAQVAMVNRSGAFEQSGMLLYLNGGTPYLLVSTTGGWDVFSGAGSYAIDEWWEFGGTYDELTGNACLYKNGELLGTFSAGTPRPIAWLTGAGRNWRLGGDDTGRTAYASFDDARVYSTAFTPEQMKAAHDLSVAGWPGALNRFNPHYFTSPSSTTVGQTISPAGVALGAAGTPAVVPRITVGPGVSGGGAGTPVRVGPPISTQTLVVPAGVAPDGVGTPAVAVTVRPSGVASSAAAGTPAAVLRIRILATVSGAAVGRPGLATPVTPVGAPSSAAVGTPVVTTAPSTGGAGHTQRVKATGVTTAGVGTPRLQTGINPAGLAAGAVGHPSLGTPIYPASITPGGVGTPAVAFPLKPASVATGAVGVPKVVSVVKPAGVDSGATGTPSLGTAISPSGVASTAAAGTPKIDLVIRPAGTYHGGVGTPVLCLQYLDVKGRFPTAVNQPPGFGHDYPIVKPSADIELLLSDFFLSYEDTDCTYTLPLHIDWLHNFGCLLNDPIGGYPVPTHARDIIVVDALGTQVFNSTQAESYVERPWGNRLKILEWRHGYQVCRVVIHTAWPSDGTSTRDYNLYIQPLAAELDARTYEKIPNRVRSLFVGLTGMTGTPVEVREGYNVALTLQPPARTDGGRFVNAVQVDAVPGAGTGRVPGCVEASPLVRKINGVGPNAAGQFFLTMDDCYWTQLPVTTAGGTSSYGTPAMSPAVARAGLEVHNACTPCCDCSYFVRTYMGLRTAWFQWYADAQEAEAARNVYEANKARWLTQYACRVAKNVDLRVTTEIGCTLQVSATYCNTSQACLMPLELRFAVALFNGTTQLSPAALVGVARDALLSDSSTKGNAEGYAVGGTWPTLLVTADLAEPQESTGAQFRLCLGNCKDIVTSAKVTLTVHAPDPGTDEDGVTHTLPVVSVPTTVSGLWTSTPADPARAIIAKTVAVDSDPLTYPCGCGTGGGGVSPPPPPPPAGNTVYGEAPSGPITGSNPAFNLADPPNPPASLLLFNNGILQLPGVGNDFVLSGYRITFQPGSTPQAGDTLIASYVKT